jgi:hypothetical protein
VKKLLTITLAIAMVFGVALTAQAINTVQMTLTSPAITKTGCERVGSATFGFDAASRIDQGDWWYMDLPSGTSICNTVDYVLVGNTVVDDATSFVNLTDSTNLIAAFSNVDGVGNTGAGVLLGAGLSDGPFSLTDIGGVAPSNIILNGTMAFHVFAPANGRRVWMYAYGDAGANIIVPPGTQFNIKVIDGNAYNKQLLLDRGTGAIAGDGIYGNSTDDEIDAVGNPTPHVENTLCVNAEGMSGDLMFTSFFSKDNKFTFTGDSQIAHVAAANPIALGFCKGDTTGDIEIGAQNACNFEYEPGTNYCTFTGNRMLIQGSSVFGDIGDRWDISVVSDTAGVYFNGPFTVAGFTPAEDPCVGAGTPVTTGAVGQFLSNGDAAAGPPGSSCSVAANNRVVNLSTADGGVQTIQTYDALWVDLPVLAYDTSIVGNGTEVDVTITLSKYPCGVIFTGTHTIGTFVTTCPAAGGAATTNLLFPWFPPMDGSLAPWWGSFVIVNAGAGSGTVALTFWEADGDVGTYTTPSLATGEQYTPGEMVNLIPMITQTGGTGTIGDSNFAITAVCNFPAGGGFAYTGSANFATGYTAYIGAGGAWQ